MILHSTTYFRRTLVKSERHLNSHIHAPSENKPLTNVTLNPLGSALNTVIIAKPKLFVVWSLTAYRELFQAVLSHVCFTQISGQAVQVFSFSLQKSASKIYAIKSEWETEPCTVELHKKLTVLGLFPRTYTAVCVSFQSPACDLQTS